MSMRMPGSEYIQGDLRFGSKASVVTSFTAVWPVTSIPRPALRDINSGDYVQLASTSASDTASGAGTRRVTITGLTTSLQQVQEVLWLNGTTPTTTAHQYISVYRMFGDRGNVNVGSIFCGYGTFTGGIPASIISQINADFGQTTQLAGFLPNGVDAHLQAFEFTMGKTGGGQEVIGEFRIRTRQIIQNSDSLFEFEPWRTRYIGSTTTRLSYGTDVEGLIFNGPVEVIVEVSGSGTGARASGNVAYEINRGTRDHLSGNV